MSSNFRIRGTPQPIGGLQITSIKTSQFEEVLQESEQLISEAKNQEESVSLPPDLSYSLKSVTSIYLDNNPRFQELKKSLEIYHLDCRKKTPQLHPGQSAQWKQIIYTSLHRLLNECVFTNVRKLQIEYLNKIYNWFYTKIGAKVKEPEKPEVQQYFANISEVSILQDRSPYTQKKAPSAGSLRPKTANTTHTKISESRPVSAVKVQAFTGAGDPSTEMPEAEFENSYISYTPLGDELDQKAEEKFRENRVKDLSEKRLRDELRAKVETWTLVRARRAEEFNRKFESNRVGSRFDYRAYTPSRPHTTSERQMGRGKVIELRDPEPQAVAFEKSSSKLEKKEIERAESEPISKMSKISALRKLHQDILEEENESYDEPNNLLDHDKNAITLGAYSKLPQRSSSRPKTAGFPPVPSTAASRGTSCQNRPITAERQSQLDEVYEVKKYLAKRNIPCAIETLKYGLLMPEDLPSENVSYLSLPAAGEGLLVNPFVKLGKKVKKGKKKGKKRSKK